MHQIYRANRNDTNLINWKRKRALHKQLIRESKRKSWIEFAKTINVDTPPQVVHENIRRIKDRPQRKLTYYMKTVPTILLSPKYVTN